MTEDGLVCKYECECGFGDFVVRYRGRKEDIVAWVENAATPALSAAHKRNSPDCKSDKCCLLIPFEEKAQSMGMRVVNS